MPQYVLAWELLKDSSGMTVEPNIVSTAKPETTTHRWPTRVATISALRKERERLQDVPEKDFDTRSHWSDWLEWFVQEPADGIGLWTPHDAPLFVQLKRRDLSGQRPVEGLNWGTKEDLLQSLEVAIEELEDRSDVVVRQGDIDRMPAVESLVLVMREQDRKILPAKVTEYGIFDDQLCVIIGWHYKVHTEVFWTPLGAWLFKYLGIRRLPF